MRLRPVSAPHRVFYPICVQHRTSCHQSLRQFSHSPRTPSLSACAVSVGASRPDAAHTGPAVCSGVLGDRPATPALPPLPLGSLGRQGQSRLLGRHFGHHPPGATSGNSRIGRQDDIGSLEVAERGLRAVARPHTSHSTCVAPPGGPAHASLWWERGALPPPRRGRVEAAVAQKPEARRRVLGCLSARGGQALAQTLFRARRFGAATLLLRALICSQ